MLLKLGKSSAVVDLWVGAINLYATQRNCQAAIDAYSACLAIDPDNKSFNAILHCNR